MVGSNHTDKNIAPPRADEDPIAELSEIMKFDLSGTAEAQDASIDLEGELLGEFAAEVPASTEFRDAAPEQEAEFTQDLAAAMSEAFAETQTHDEGTGPSVPAELESQLQALLAELGGSGDDRSDEGVHDLDLDFGESESPAGHMAEDEPSPEWHAQEEAEPADEPVPAHSEAVDPDAEFSDEFSRVIAELEGGQQQSALALNREPDVFEDQEDAREQHFEGTEASMQRVELQDIEQLPDEDGSLAEEPFAADAAAHYSEPAGPDPDPYAPHGIAPDFVEYDDAPEIETAELPDAIEQVADDLDIPEIHYEEEPAAQPELYEFESDFSNSFDDLNEFDDLPDDRAVSAASASDAGYEPETGRPDAGFEYLAPVAAAAGAAGGYAASSRAQDRSAGELGGYRPSDDSYRFDDSDPASDDFYTAVPGDDELRESGGKRFGLLIAAAVATVAIAGGVGYFALSDGGGDGPVLVQADDDPLKVKPEDPGGTTAPHEDKAVYERVAGLDDNPTPSQQTLIATDEEPIDIEAASRPRVVLPSSGEAPAPAVPAAAPKAEDRIEPDETEAAEGQAEEFVAIEPRRVRTLIVKPDGTLVPREEAVAPAVAEGLRTSTGSDALVAAAEPVSRMDDAAQLASDAEDAAPVVNRPQEVAAARGQTDIAAGTASTPATQTAPSEPARAEVVAPQAPAPAAPQAPAVPAPQTETQLASAPAAPSNVEYWVQVSSQPSRELAQASYTDIARRHGDLVAGRAVNIYPAEIEGRGTFYRVRVAGGSRDEANTLCSRLKNAGASCFVSR